MRAELGSTTIFTRELDRMLQTGAPGAVVVRLGAAPAAAEVYRVAEALALGPVCMTGEAVSPELRAELERRALRLTPTFARPRSRYVDSLWHELTLFDVHAGAAPGR